MEEVSQNNNHNTRNAIEKSTSVNALEKELQYVAQIQKKLQNSSGCNDVAVLNVAFDGERWKNEALMAVEVANLLTSLWPVKTSAGRSIIENDRVLFEIARANTGFSRPYSDPWSVSSQGYTEITSAFVHTRLETVS